MRFESCSETAFRSFLDRAEIGLKITLKNTFWWSGLGYVCHRRFFFLFCALVNMMKTRSSSLSGELSKRRGWEVSGLTSPREQGNDCHHATTAAAPAASPTRGPPASSGTATTPATDPGNDPRRAQPGPAWPSVAQPCAKHGQPARPAPRRTARRTNWGRSLVINENTP